MIYRTNYQIHLIDGKSVWIQTVKNVNVRVLDSILRIEDVYGNVLYYDEDEWLKVETI